MIKDIIFDMDGTLSNTAVATLASVKEIEDKYQLPPLTLETIHRAMGIGGFGFYKLLFPTVPIETLRKVEAEVDVLEDIKIAEMGREILFPDVYDMIVSLKEKGIRLHIASTGNPNHVKVTLTSSGIMPFFTTISYNEPTKINMVRRMIGHDDPREWAMVGDMFKDSEAARANHILAIGADFGYLSPDDYHLFDRIIYEPMEIHQVLD